MNPSVETYNARLQNASKVWNTFRNLLSAGNYLIDENNEVYRDPAMFVETDRVIGIKYGNCTIMYFLKDIDFDNGAHLSIEEYNDQFKDWKCIPPSKFVSIQL